MPNTDDLNKRQRIEQIWLQTRFLSSGGRLPPMQLSGNNFDWAFWFNLLDADPVPQGEMREPTIPIMDNVLQGVIALSRNGQEYKGNLVSVELGGVEYSPATVKLALDTMYAAGLKDAAPAKLPTFLEEYRVNGIHYGIEQCRNGYVVWRNHEKFGLDQTLTEAREIVFRAARERAKEDADTFAERAKGAQVALNRLGDDVFNLGRFGID